MPSYQKCEVCTRDIRTMAFMGTGVCCDLCRKKRDGDDPLVQPVKSRAPMADIPTRREFRAT